jgi:CDP-diacylglycerol--glycerol-3-phosphate 3-phosphatidyltransferase
MRHVPNILTVLRILVTPLALWLLTRPTLGAVVAGTTIFILAAITDYYDGKMSRKYGVESRLGQFLDPLADKILVLGGFFALPFVEPVSEGLYSLTAFVCWAAILSVAARDFAVTGLRSYAEARGRSIPTLNVAKMKTAWQLTFLISLQVFLCFAKLDELGGELGSTLAPFAGFFEAVLRSIFPALFLIVTSAITVYTGVLYFQKPEPTPSA